MENIQLQVGTGTRLGVRPHHTVVCYFPVPERLVCVLEMHTVHDFHAMFNFAS